LNVTKLEFIFSCEETKNLLLILNPLPPVTSLEYFCNSEIH